MYQKAILTVVLANLVLILGAACVTGVKWERMAAKPVLRMKLDASYTADEKSSTMGVVYMSASLQRVVDCAIIEKEPQRSETAEMESQRSETAEMESQRSETAEMESQRSETEKMEPQQGQSGAEEMELRSPRSETGEAVRQSDAGALVYQLDEEEYELLLRIVEAEAGSEDEDGRLLVANVVFNRVNSDQFPDTVSEVILQRHKGSAQFSPVDSGRIWRVEISETTTAAVQRALEGEDLSQGALYFAARRYADSANMRWFDEKLTFLFQHGAHEFFS